MECRYGFFKIFWNLYSFHPALFPFQQVTGRLKSVRTKVYELDASLSSLKNTSHISSPYPPVCNRLTIWVPCSLILIHKLSTSPFCIFVFWELCIHPLLHSSPVSCPTMSQLLQQCCSSVTPACVPGWLEAGMFSSCFIISDVTHVPTNLHPLFLTPVHCYLT